MGVYYKYDTVQSEYYGTRQANGISPYLQETWQVDDHLTLSSGLRLDTYTLVGDSLEMQWSPKLGVNYKLSPLTNLHASIGRAFRAATVVERFISAGSKDFRALPNPDLLPERSTLADVGLRKQFSDQFYLESTWFWSLYEHLIEPTLSSDLTAQFINTPRAQITGLELEARLSLWQDRFNLRSSATWMDPIETESGQTLLYRPRWIGYLGTTLQLNRFTLEGDYRYISRLENVALFPLDERVATHIVDLRVGYPWKRLLFQFIIKNGFNYNYTVSERVLGEIRNFSFSLSGTL